MTRVGVLGAGGRMGRAVCRAVADDPELDLVCAVDPDLSPDEPVPVPAGLDTDVAVGTDIDLLARTEASVAVDFTVAEAAMQHMRWCASHGVHAVVGTTGIPPAFLADVGAEFARGVANCVVAPNFAIGAVLMMRFAEMAAPYMASAEIVELHHDGKLDAPSGTALLTADRMGAARRAAQAGAWPGDRTATEAVAGVRGGAGAEGVHMHSVRLPGLVAHQEVIFGATGQSLTIRHDAYDRSSFMPGVLMAVKAVAQRPGMTIGLDALLGL